MLRRQRILRDGIAFLCFSAGAVSCVVSELDTSLGERNAGTGANVGQDGGTGGTVVALSGSGGMFEHADGGTGTSGTSRSSGGVGQSPPGGWEHVGGGAAGTAGTTNGGPVAGTGSDTGASGGGRTSSGGEESSGGEDNSGGEESSGGGGGTGVGEGGEGASCSGGQGGDGGSRSRGGRGGDGAWVYHTCSSGEWDDDDDPTTTCVLWTNCEPGTYVSSTPSATRDRVCTDCPEDTYTSEANQSQCLVQGSCEPGTVQTEPGSDTVPPACEDCDVGTYCLGGTAPMEACTSGTWDDDSDPATPCVGWTDCEAGTYATNTPSATVDRACDDCADGTYTDQANLSGCLEPGACAAGTVQVTPGTDTTPPTCDDCEPGTYCEGGTAPQLACATGTWDHDSSAATACVNWTMCSAGTYVSKSPSATVDRACTACTSGFTNTPNATACTAWETCAAGSYVSAAPTSTRDRDCAACGSGFTTTTNAASCSPWTNCVAGTYVSVRPISTRDRECADCTGGFTNTTNAPSCSPWTACSPGTAEVPPLPSSTTDRTCSYYVWSTTYGSTSNDYGRGIVATGNYLYITGETQGTLPNEVPSGGSSDAFVMQFTTSGDHEWTVQFGSGEADSGRRVAADAEGAAYVVGLMGEYHDTSNDYRNGFLRKFNFSGGDEWGATFGRYGMYGALVWGSYAYAAGFDNTAPAVARYTLAGVEQTGLSISTGGYGPEQLVVDPTNSYLYVAGHTYESLDAQTNQGWTDVYIRKHNSALQHVANGTIMFGTPSTDYAADICVDGPGNVYVSGRMSAGSVRLGASEIATVNQTYSAFLSKFNSSLAHQWTKIVYLGANESFNAIAGAADGSVYVAGNNTLRKYDQDGDLVFGHNLGGAVGRDLFLTNSGELYLVGDLSGDLFIARMAP